MLELNEKESKLLSTMKASNGPVTIADAANECWGDKSKEQAQSWVRNCLRKLVTLKLVNQVGRGTYEVSRLVKVLSEDKDVDKKVDKKARKELIAKRAEAVNKREEEVVYEAEDTLSLADDEDEDMDEDGCPNDDDEVYDDDDEDENEDEDDDEDEQEED